jgi:putative chitinase
VFEAILRAIAAIFGRKPLTSPTAPASPFPIDSVTMERVVLAASLPQIPRDVVAVAAALRAACVKYGVVTPIEIAHLIAQLAHESGGFRFTREIWRDTPAQLRYENHRNLGNTEPGDGKRFAGIWWVQLTGRWNHQAYADYRGMTIEELHALADDIYTSADVSLWYVSVLRKGFLAAARNNNIEAATRVINGGLNGFEDRKRRFAAVAAVLSVAHE